MFRFKKFFTFFFIALLYAGQSSACQTLIVADILEEIKEKEGDFIIQESNGGFYLDSSLLVLQEDGIHLNYGDIDFLIPYIYHDTIGYLMSPEACWDLGIEWLCCRCNHKNDNNKIICHVCHNRRCGH